MNIIIYDKTFEGFLSAVFDCYDKKIIPVAFEKEDGIQTLLFATAHMVVSDSQKADRVWKGLLKKLSESACKMLAIDFLSEQPDIELLLFRYIQKAFQSSISIETNFGDPCVLEIHQIFKKVVRETERVRMFVRFQKTVDNIYFASFDPQFNVLPLTINHFKARFSDQAWIVYDTNRNYGFYYDLSSVNEIKFDDSKINPLTGVLDQSAFTEDEKLFQSLWKVYFKEIEIKERHNLKLHKRLLPKRFWKYLTEKQ
jgi:probable DNA metabolism protein